MVHGERRRRTGRRALRRDRATSAVSNVSASSSPASTAASISSHDTGVDTVGRSRMRNEYAHTVVLWLSFWLQSTNTRSGRLAFAMSTVTRFGSRDFEQLPEREGEPLRLLVRRDSACSAGTERCNPLPPDVFTTDDRGRSGRGCRAARARRGRSRARSAGAPGSRSSTTAVGCHGSATVHWWVCSSSAARLASQTSAGELLDHAALLAAAGHDRLGRHPVRDGAAGTASRRTARRRARRGPAPSVGGRPARWGSITGAIRR